MDKEIKIVYRATKKGLKSAKKMRASDEECTTFIMPKKRKSERNSDYLRRVYRLNEDFFERPLEGRAFGAGHTLQAFKQEVYERMDEFHLKDISKAAIISVRSKWMSGEEVAHINAIEGLKSQIVDYREGKDGEQIPVSAYDKLRMSLRDEHHRFRKFDVSKLDWNEDDQAYEYEDFRFGWSRSKGKSPNEFFFYRKPPAKKKEAK